MLLVDNQQLFLDLLEYMLCSNKEIQVIGKVVNGNEACEYATRLNPDIILIDIIMPYCNGIEVIKQIKEKKHDVKILVLTASTLGNDVNEALASGVDGYILKSTKKESIMLAIKSVYANMQVIDSKMSTFIRKQKANTELKTRTVDIQGVQIKLSERELKIIKMIAQGKTTSEMAKKLFITEGRLRNIITEILSKLMLKDRSQIAIFAIKNKLD